MRGEKENLLIKMGITMTDNGFLMKHLVMVFINRIMDANMKASGAEIFSMEKEKKLGQMEAIFKDNTPQD